MYADRTGLAFESDDDAAITIEQKGDPGQVCLVRGCGGSVGGGGSGGSGLGRAGTRPAGVAAQPNFVTTPSGVSVAVPPGWTARTTANGRGIQILDPVSGRNIRVMDWTPRYPNGYVRLQNAHGNYLDALGRVNSNPAATHLDIGALFPGLGPFIR